MIFAEVIFLFKSDDIYIRNQTCLGLALTNLLTTQSATVLQRFKPIMINILETLNDITKSDDDGIAVDSLVLVQGQSPSHFDEEGAYYETDHDCRKKQLILNDPVHNIVLKDYLQAQVRYFN